jgi:hypothetical protein
MSAHTPGPWSIHPGAFNGARIDGPNGRGVAHATQRDPHPTFGEGITQQEADANARLIAAAPDLLEALQEATARSAARLAEVPGAKRTEDFEALFQKCLDAIKKATEA